MAQDSGAAIHLSGLLLTSPPGDDGAQSTEEEIRAVFESAVLPQTIPYDPEVGQAFLLGKTVIEVAPDVPAARAFRALAVELGLTSADKLDSEIDASQHTEAIEDVPPPWKTAPPEVVTPAEPVSWRPIEVSAATETSPAVIGHRGNITALAFTPNGEQLVTASWDGAIKIWDVATHRERATLVGHGGAVAAIAVSADGTSIASGGHDKSVRLWDIQRRMETRTFTGHDGVVTAVASSPDGRSIASGSWDTSIRIWNAESGTEIATLLGHDRMVTSVCLRAGRRRRGVGQLGPHRQALEPQR